MSIPLGWPWRFARTPVPQVGQNLVSISKSSRFIVLGGRGGLPGVPLTWVRTHSPSMSLRPSRR